MEHRHWSRRSLLKASLFTLAAVACGTHAGGTLASGTLTGATGGEPLELALYNIHTGETLTAAYRDSSGCPIPDALNAFDQLLRCHYTGEIHPIDIDTLDYLAQVDAKLGGCNHFHVISGYRSPLYNERLRQSGSGGVAAQSLHLVGQALDIRLPSRPLNDLHRCALNLQCGGVGFYRRENFVHLDSGPCRTW